MVTGGHGAPPAPAPLPVGWGFLKCSDSVTTQPLNMEVCPALDQIKTKKSAIPKTIAQWMVSGHSGGDGKNVNLIEERFVVEKLVDSKDGKDGVNTQVLMGSETVGFPIKVKAYFEGTPFANCTLLKDPKQSLACMNVPPCDT
ncbi:unnamed protein product [Coregonus sp. 'balchen']|nr:unnamed protein product [Coregonus sp. 'balchen']